nr:unnamed protein product [Spirometra erinaceieuropaei]
MDNKWRKYGVFLLRLPSAPSLVSFSNRRWLALLKRQLSHRQQVTATGTVGCITVSSVAQCRTPLEVNESDVDSVPVTESSSLAPEKFQKVCRAGCSFSQPVLAVR